MKLLANTLRKGAKIVGYATVLNLEVSFYELVQVEGCYYLIIMILYTIFSI